MGSETGGKIEHTETQYHAVRLTEGVIIEKGTYNQYLFTGYCVNCGSICHSPVISEKVEKPKILQYIYIIDINSTDPVVATDWISQGDYVDESMFTYYNCNKNSCSAGVVCFASCRARTSWSGYPQRTLAKTQWATN